VHGWPAGSSLAADSRTIRIRLALAYLLVFGEGTLQDELINTIMSSNFLYTRPFAHFGLGPAAGLRHSESLFWLFLAYQIGVVHGLFTAMHSGPR